MTAPLILSVDTASARGVVVLSRGEVVLAASTYVAGSDHAEKLLDHVRAVLTRAAIPLERVERFAVGVGPGSFTGVRVGVATIKAFVLAFPRSVVTVSTLSVLVEGAAQTWPAIEGSKVGALLSAGREDAFVGVFSASSSAARAVEMPPVEVVSHANLPSYFATNELAFAVGANVQSLLPNVTDRTADEGLPTPGALASLAALAVVLGRTAVIDLEPAYARPPQITSSRGRSPAV